MTSQNLPSQLRRGAVLVAGAGVSGLGAARVLAELGVPVTVADDNPAALDKVREATGEKATCISVAEAQQKAADWGLVVTSPGWRPDAPLLTTAQDAGVEAIGDVELAYLLDRAEVFGKPRTWLVVTGTNGKTTTTGMLAAIMDADSARSGKRAQAVGNIGISLYNALSATPRIDILVAELSSFQLHWSEELTPDVGAVLNLAEDHIDWHGSFDAYAADKAKALSGENAVIGLGDEHVREIAQKLRDEGTLAKNTYGFSAEAPKDGEVGVLEGRLVAEGIGKQGSVDLASAEGIQPVGLAGVLDAAAAATVALVAGAAPESIAEGLAAYTVSGHRGAVVHSANGIDFIDNSKATNPHAADAALRGVDSVVWVAGGQLKGAEVDDLVRAHAPKLRAVVLLGIDRQLLADALAQHAPHVPVTVIDSTDPQEAMDAAVAAAVQHAVAGDTVLLAPAAASLDMYTGMAQRGDMFAAAAKNVQVR